MKCLETNIYSTASPDMNSLSADDRNLAHFKLLVKVVAPRVIVAHGNDASREAQRFSDHAAILTAPHFSRGWSHEAARDLGAKIRALAE